MNFERCFMALTGNGPFPWQGALFRRLVAGDIPRRCDIPTGLGKTSVLPIWLLALAEHAALGRPRSLPRRLAYVVNRRTVVDQATREAEALLGRLSDPALVEFWERLRSLGIQRDAGLPHLDGPIAISTLRGQFADNGAWRADPSRPAIIVGTVDMIGSRLLFNGYGRSFRTRPLHAAFLGQDTLLVHDEAHLEPAFQELLIKIEEEQRRGDGARRDGFGRLCVMALTATSRVNAAEPSSVLGLDDDDRRHEVVRKRLFAKKTIAFHKADLKKVPDRIAELALAHEKGGEAILIFARTVEDVQKIAKKLPTDRVAKLTGTIRGLEREQLRNNTVFARFDPKSPARDRMQSGTVYLLCTSAGEVGVDISADHLVCDLTPFDSMAQRLGRVNRYGDGDARVDVIHETDLEDASESGAPPTGDTPTGTGKPRDGFALARARTLSLFQSLPAVDNGLDASPAALQKLPGELRLGAFSPSPLAPPVTEVLFDSWALTTIRERFPGRPPVADWLHGIAEWEPPETRVAWRHEVERLPSSTDAAQRRELLELYPLKPQELLRDSSKRVFKELAQIASRAGDAPVWLLDEEGAVQETNLAKVAEGKEDGIQRKTVLLPPSVGGLSKHGALEGDEEHREDTQYDVADLWFDERELPRRVRIEVKAGEKPPQLPRGMRLVVDLPIQASDAEEDAENTTRWRWYVDTSSSDEQGSRTGSNRQTLAFHLASAEHFARALVTALQLVEPEGPAIVWAARFHDLGKGRRLWQRSIGNFDPRTTLAKSDRWRAQKRLTRYRHEFGSLIDIEREREFQGLTDAAKELARHLVAAHHGRARPYFPDDEVFDPDHSDADSRAVARDVPRRFARLQRTYGRWGLAYLESLVRSADVLASLAAENAEPAEAAE